MPTERSKRMAERRARREAEAVGRKEAKAAERLEEAARGLRPGWYRKKEIAAYFGCSGRTVNRWMAEGLPHALIAGAVKFKPEECESWLEEHGHLDRKGER